MLLANPRERYLREKFKLSSTSIEGDNPNVSCSRSKNRGDRCSTRARSTSEIENLDKWNSGVIYGQQFINRSSGFDKIDWVVQIRECGAVGLIVGNLVGLDESEDSINTRVAKPAAASLASKCVA